MESTVTTYRQDYLWPYVKTMAVRPGPKYSTLPQPESLMGPPTCLCHDWAQRGPTGPMQDPKLFAPRMGPAPLADTSRFDQPNTYLRKLHARCPFLYNVLQTAPPDDLLARVYGDRFRSTYQVDFDHRGLIPSEEYDRLIAGALCRRGEGPAHLPYDPTRPQMRSPIAFRPAVISGGSSGGSSGGKGGGSGRMGGFKAQTWGPGVSEYTDSIGKMGQMIMTKKMLGGR